VKRLALASSALAIFVPGNAEAQLSHSQTTAYGRAYTHVKMTFGARAAGCKLIGPGASCHVPATDAAILASTDVLQRMFAPPPPVATATSTFHTVAIAGTAVVSNSSSTVPYGGGYGDVPGVPPGFASCVAMRESTNGAGSSNIYGIQGPGGQGSIAEQKQAFAQMYAQRGTEPWSPYDGC
jgi:hypothetical protein